MAVNENFIDVFKMKLAAGRSFSSAFKTDSNDYLVNEKILSIMGLNASTAVGKALTLWGPDPWLEKIDWFTPNHTRHWRTVCIIHRIVKTKHNSHPTLLR